jgi:hypothetical protein
MTAIEYVARIQDAAEFGLSLARQTVQSDGSKGRFYVHADGTYTVFTWAAPLNDAIATVTLTPENVRDESSLIRALVRSAIVVTTDNDGNFIATLADESRAHPSSSTLAEIALVDALLAPKENDLDR